MPAIFLSLFFSFFVNRHKFTQPNDFYFPVPQSRMSDPKRHRVKYPSERGTSDAIQALQFAPLVCKYVCMELSSFIMSTSPTPESRHSPSSCRGAVWQVVVVGGGCWLTEVFTPRSLSGVRDRPNLSGENFPGDKNPRHARQYKLRRKTKHQGRLHVFFNLTDRHLNNQASELLKMWMREGATLPQTVQITLSLGSSISD